MNQKCEIPVFIIGLYLHINLRTLNSKERFIRLNCVELPQNGKEGSQRKAACTSGRTREVSQVLLQLSWLTNESCLASQVAQFFLGSLFWNCLKHSHDTQTGLLIDRFSNGISGNFYRTHVTNQAFRRHIGEIF